MKRVFLRLVLPLCVVALGAACQKSGTPAKPADADKLPAAATSQTATPQPGGQPPLPGAPGLPGATGVPGAPGAVPPNGQPAEAPVKPVPRCCPPSSPR